MSTKIKTVDDCTSGMDYLELAQREGWEIRKNGSYWEIEQNGVMVRFPNKALPLPKETRSVINGALLKAGLLLAVVVAVLVACGAAWTW